MNQNQAIRPLEESQKVFALDEAIRARSRNYNFPWVAKKKGLRVFEDVLEYPVQPDHKDLLYMDNNGDNINLTYADRARFRFTSLRQFYENPDFRSQIAEIWNGYTRYLGIRYNPTDAASAELTSADDISVYTKGGDVTSFRIDSVNFVTGNSSLQFSIVNSSSVANIAASIPPNLLQNFQKYYFFQWVYFDGIPSSVALQYGTDASNYYYSIVTAQFSGQPFQQGQWNLLAFDLNAASKFGTPTGTFSHQNFVMFGAPSGTYFLDASAIKTWEQLDYWYYSKNNVLNADGVTYQPYFMDANEAYLLDNELQGEPEWADTVMYDAMLSLLAEKSNSVSYKDVVARRDQSLLELKQKYPDESQLITTNRWRWRDSFSNPNGVNYNGNN